MTSKIEEAKGLDLLMKEFKDSVLACKSQADYEKWYVKYEQFKEKNNCQDDNEGVFIGF
jgi:hypothetical protein